jgi:hypothetical protein
VAQSARRILLLVVAAAAAVSLQWFGGPEFRRFVRDVAGHPARQGPWLTAEHMLVQTTLMAAACWLVWAIAARVGALPPIRESLHVREPKRIALWALIASALIIALVCGVVVAIGQPFAPHRPDGWGVLGNVFSNFYEDFIFSGFVFVVLWQLTGKSWIAVVGVALLFAAVHTQYPLELRASIFVSTLLMGVARVRTGTIWTVWLVHMISDIVLDALLPF